MIEFRDTSTPWDSDAALSPGSPGACGAPPLGALKGETMRITAALLEEHKAAYYKAVAEARTAYYRAEAEAWAVCDKAAYDKAVAKAWAAFHKAVAKPLAAYDKAKAAALAGALS